MALRIAGAAIVLFGAWFLWQATSLREGPGYAAVGPRVFPVAVGLGFLASGLAVLVSGWRGYKGSAPDFAESEQGAADWPTLAAVAALLALYVALFLPLGFLIMSSAFVLGAARILGSRSVTRDLLSGVLLSLLTFVVFTRLLGLELPAGPLEEPIRAMMAGAPS